VIVGDGPKGDPIGLDNIAVTMDFAGGMIVILQHRDGEK
jgi:hypothetical protein